MYGHQNTSTVDPVIQAVPVTVFCAQLDLLHKYYIMRSLRQLLAENIKQLFCIIICFPMMGHWGSKRVGAVAF